MIRSVTPAFLALSTSSRSLISTTSAISGLARETRWIGDNVVIGIERPTAMSSGMTVSPKITCAEVDAALTTPHAKKARPTNEVLSR